MPVVQPAGAIRSIATGAFTDAKFSPDGTRLYAVSGDTVMVIDVASGTTVNQFTLTTDLGAVDVSANGAFLAVLGTQLGSSGTLFRIDLSTGTVSSFSTSLGFNALGSFHDVAFLADGNMLVTQRTQGGSDPVRLLDVGTGQFSIPGGIMSQLSTVGPATLATSADHSHVQIAAARFPGATTYVYQTGVGVVAQVNNSPADPFAGASVPNLINRGVLATSPNESFFVQGLRVMNSSLQTLVSLDTIAPFIGGAQGLAFSADSQRFYAATSNYVIVFNTANWQPIGTYPIGGTVASAYDSSNGTYTGFGDILQASQDGRYLTVIGSSGLRVIDLTQALFESTVGDDVIAGEGNLIGLAGNDDITSLSGFAFLYGGPGNDTYRVNSQNVMVQEFLGEGRDTVRSTVTYTLPTFVEDLVLEGGANIIGYGNGLDNSITGNSGNNVLNGNAGNDTINGSDGDDILDGGPGDDTLDGGAGNDAATYASASSAVTVDLAIAGPQNTGGAGIDTFINIENLIGSSANDQLRGNSGANRLDGGAGADTLAGRAGDDTYVIDNAGDVVTELAGEGYDRVFSTLSGVIQENVEEMIVTGNSLTALGDGRDNVLSVAGGFGNSLYGLDGNDVLNGSDQSDLVVGGGPGNDVVSGNGGDDLIVGGAGSDQIDGGAGFDTVDYSREFGSRPVYVNLSDTLTFEPLLPPGGIAVPLDPHTAHDSFGNTDTLTSIERIVTGSGDDLIRGSGATETFETGDGNDLISSGGGGDLLIGGAGNDTYTVSTGDVIVELPDGGNDAVSSALATFSIENIANVENIFGGLATGQTLTGNSLNNFISGLGGNDNLFGGAGDDTLSPGLGIDTMTGGTGVDTFAGQAASLNGDTIADFSAGERIRISNATLEGFTFSLSGNTLTFTGGSLTLSSVPAGHLVASASAEGGVQLTMMPLDVRTDINGDRRGDIIVRDAQSGWLTDWLGAGSGGLSNNGANASIHIPLDWKIAGGGDYNGDGRDDVLLRSDAGWLTNWLGTDNGGLSNNGANTSLFFTPDWKVVGNGDFNADGKADLLLRRDDGWLTNWLGTTTGSFANNGANTSLFFTTDWKIASTGDFNGDGYTDILLRRDDGWVTNWLGNSSGGFTNNGANTALFFTTDWKVIGTGDVNGDGKDDLILRRDDGWITDWLGTSTGSFTNNGVNTALFLTTDWKIGSIADFNGDGREDLLLRNDSGWMTDWLGTQAGSFTNNGANFSTFIAPNWVVQDPFM